MSSPETHQVVLDTNIVIGAGSRWLASEPAQPATTIQRLVHSVATRHVGLYCDEILEEYVELLLRRNHPQERITRYIALIKELFKKVTITSTTCPTAPSDPDDTVFLLCALDGNADLLVSDDGHLLTIRPAYLPKLEILPTAEASERLQVAGGEPK